MEMLRQEYQSSGRIGLSLLTLPLVGLVSAFALAAGYGFASVYNPSMKLAALLPFAGGMALGGMLYLGALVGKCRSALFTTIVSVFVGAIFAYVVWAFFIFALSWRTDGADTAPLLRCFDPFVVVGIMDVIVENGWFERNGVPVTGDAFWWKWAGEALIIIATAAFVPAFAIWNKPFCESSGRWMSKTKGAMNFQPVPDESTFARIAAGDLTTLLSLEQIASDETPLLRMDLWTSDDPDSIGVYQVHFVEAVAGKKGEMEEKAKELTQKLVLSSNETQMLKAKMVVSFMETAAVASAPPEAVASQPSRPPVSHGFDDTARADDDRTF